MCLYDNYVLSTYIYLCILQTELNSEFTLTLNNPFNDESPIWEVWTTYRRGVKTLEDVDMVYTWWT